MTVHHQGLRGMGTKLRNQRAFQYHIMCQEFSLKDQLKKCIDRADKEGGAAADITEDDRNANDDDDAGYTEG